MMGRSMEAPANSAAPTTAPRPLRRWTAEAGAVDLSELWAYRELLLFLVWRELKIRYKQTLLGGAWAILQPLLGMVVFSVFFGRLAKMPSDGAPYAPFAYAGLWMWTYFATAVTGASQSLVAQQYLLTKVYFPRLHAPLAACLTPLVDLGVASLVLVPLLLASGIAPTWRLLLLPVIALGALVAALGVGLILAAVNVTFRDVRYALPFFVQVWLFATPVAYPASIVPAAWRPLYGLNPMVGVIEATRWAILDGPAPEPLTLACSAGVALVALVIGVCVFSRAEGRFADVV